MHFLFLKVIDKSSEVKKESEDISAPFMLYKTSTFLCACPEYKYQASVLWLNNLLYYIMLPIIQIPVLAKQ